RSSGARRRGRGRRGGAPGESTEAKCRWLTPGHGPGARGTRVDRPRGHAAGFKNLGSTEPGAWPREHTPIGLTPRAWPRGSRNWGRPTPRPRRGVQAPRVDRARGMAPGTHPDWVNPPGLAREHTPIRLTPGHGPGVGLLRRARYPDGGGVVLRGRPARSGCDYGRPSLRSSRAPM